jgi:hypothetical protein
MMFGINVKILNEIQASKNTENQSSKRRKGSLNLVTCVSEESSLRGAWIMDIASKKELSTI